MSNSDTSARPLHLLSLDGGGVRGLSIIIILRHLMRIISRKRGRIVQPWEEFDMIGGTSGPLILQNAQSIADGISSLIAIMLGRLRMTLDECESVYLSLSEQIFHPTRARANVFGRGKDFLQANRKFDSKILEDAIKSIVVQKCGSESELLKDNSDQCRVFVCALLTGNSGTAILRSYENDEPELLLNHCTIWEACRATSAAATFFDPIKIGPYEQEFADDGVIYNNPVQLVHREASVTWRDRMNDAVLISIGTGSAPGGSFTGNIMNLIEAMKDIVTQTERTAEIFSADHENMVDKNRYYRFNVVHGLASVGLEEWQEKAKISNATQVYLDSRGTNRKVQLCVETLCKLGANDVARDQNSTEPRGVKRKMAYLVDSYPSGTVEGCLQTLSFRSIDDRRDNIELALQHTCDWVFESSQFQKWRDRVELKNLLLSAYKEHQSISVVLLIDALDECSEEEVRVVIYFLETLSKYAASSQSCLRICLSSRHYPTISIDKKLELILENQEEHNRDIAKYVVEKLRVTDEGIKTEILEKAQHVFLWVVLVVELLNKAYDGGKLRAMRVKLREVPRGLDEIFLAILTKDNPDKEETWILCAIRPLKSEELYFGVLSTQELEEFGASDKSKLNAKDIERYIINISKGLVEVRTNKYRKTSVQFIHESVTDFLIRQQMLEQIDPSLKPHAIGISHDRLASRCMSYIMQRELDHVEEELNYENGFDDEQILKQESNIADLRNKQSKTLADSYPFLDYATKNLLVHADKAQVNSVPQQALLERLLNRDFKRLRSFHDIFEREYYGHGELLYALSATGSYHLIQILLSPQYGSYVGINRQGGYCGNALQAGIEGYGGNADAIVTTLLEHGADVNAEVGLFRSALTAAVSPGKNTTVRLLLEHGADVNGGNVNGHNDNPLLVALDELDFNKQRQYELIELLLYYGADVNVESDFSGSALYLAIIYSGPKAVKLLLEHGANFNSRCDRALSILLQYLDDDMFDVGKEYLKQKEDAEESDFVFYGRFDGFT